MLGRERERAQLRDRAVLHETRNGRDIRCEIVIELVMRDVLAHCVHHFLQARAGLMRRAQIDALRRGEQLDRQNVRGVFRNVAEMLSNFWILPLSQ